MCEGILDSALGELDLCDDVGERYRPLNLKQILLHRVHVTFDLLFGSSIVFLAARGDCVVSRTLIFELLDELFDLLGL